MHRPLLIFVLLLFASCGRPLTEHERAFASNIHGETLDLDRVRLVEGAPVAAVTFTRKARPRITCRERIMPPVKEETVTARPNGKGARHNIWLASRD